MDGHKPYIVVFAGVPGTSKTPIAHYLSCEFNLPIISTDQIRYEVREDLRLDDINKPGGVEEYKKRLAERFKKLLSLKISFIADGSMDRRWSEVKEQLLKADYDWFMINIELSRDFQEKLFRETGRAEWARTHMDDYIAQHNAFAERFGSDISMRITDNEFSQRLRLAKDGLGNYIRGRNTE